MRPSERFCWGLISLRVAFRDDPSEHITYCAGVVLSAEVVVRKGSTRHRNLCGKSSPSWENFCAILLIQEDYGQTGSVFLSLAAIRLTLKLNFAQRCSKTGEGNILCLLQPSTCKESAPIDVPITCTLTHNRNCICDFLSQITFISITNEYCGISRSPWDDDC